MNITSQDEKVNLLNYLLHLQTYTIATSTIPEQDSYALLSSVQDLGVVACSEKQHANETENDNSTTKTSNFVSKVNMSLPVILTSVLLCQLTTAQHPKQVLAVATNHPFYLCRMQHCTMMSHLHFKTWKLRRQIKFPTICIDTTININEQCS